MSSYEYVVCVYVLVPGTALRKALAALVQLLDCCL